MAKVKYYYDEDTLSYRKIAVKKSDYYRKILFSFLGVILIAFIGFIGFSQTIQALQTMGAEKTDKVRIGYTLSSKQYTNKDGIKRYSTSAIIDRVEMLEKNVVKQTEVVFVNSETGEIIESDNQ